jgi:hypothetical protein
MAKAAKAQPHLKSTKPATVTGTIATADATAFCLRDKLNEATLHLHVRRGQGRSAVEAAGRPAYKNFT